MSIRAILELLAATIVIVAFLFWSEHERNVEHTQDLASDARALQVQQDQQAKDVLKYGAQLKEADRVHSQDQVQLSAVAARPTPHIVCRAASNSSKVPSLPASPSGQLPTPGNTDELRGSYDPGPDLRTLHLYYDGLIEQCRDTVNRWPHK